MSRTEEILAELLAEEEQEKADREGAPQVFVARQPSAFMVRRPGGYLERMTDEEALLAVAIEASASAAVLRRRVADLTARLEELEGRRP